MKPHVFTANVETAELWLDEMIEILEATPADREQALQALRAGLHAIRDRLPANEVVDLGAQLPRLVRGLYYEGWRLTNDPGKIHDAAAMIARVAKELPGKRFDPQSVLRATIEILVAHVSPGELLDMLATMPRPIANLWHDLTGHALHDLEASRSVR